MRKDVEDCAIELGGMASMADDVAGAQAAAKLMSNRSVQYWAGYAAACRKAAKMVRRLKDEIV